MRRSFRLRPLKSDCFDQVGGPLPRSERYDYVKSFAGFDPFAGADSNSWTSRVMSSSLDSVVQVWEVVALDWSNSSVRLCRGNGRRGGIVRKFSLYTNSFCILNKNIPLNINFCIYRVIGPHPYLTFFASR